MKLLVALSAGEPLSVTTTVIVLTLGPCDSAGVQLMAPVSGTIVIPAGGERRLNESVLAGISESVAEAETDNVVSSSIQRLFCHFGLPEQEHYLRNRRSRQRQSNQFANRCLQPRCPFRTASEVE